MPPLSRAPSSAITALLLASALAVSAQAARGPRKSASVPVPDCKTLSDSLLRLYEAGDPAYLAWDFSGAKCDSSQLYTAYYYQGIGFLFISAWKEALYFLNAARAIGGPKDEEILYHLWTLYRKLDRYPEMERLTVELHHRYPSSLFLMEILDEWKAIKAPSRVSWSYSTRAGVASIPYLDDMLTNRIQAETRQQTGRHRFRERASLSVSSRFSDSLAPAWADKIFHGFQANLGFEYGWRGITAEADWGAGYETHGRDSTLLDANGRQSVLVDSNWNFAQGRIALGYSYTTPGGWNLGVNAALFQLNSDWRGISFSHSESVLFPAFILIGYFEIQKHWIGIPKDSILVPVAEGEPERYGYIGLDGMYAFIASLSPYFSSGRHSFGLGPTCYITRTHSSISGISEGDLSGDDWQYAISATSTYGFDVKPWWRVSATGAYGFNLEKKSGDANFTFYSADLAMSFSF